MQLQNQKFVQKDIIAHGTQLNQLNAQLELTIHKKVDLTRTTVFHVLVDITVLIELLRSLREKISTNVHSVTIVQWVMD